MGLNELINNCARLRIEINSVGGARERSEAKLALLLSELDQIEQDLATFRRLAGVAAPLRDEVAT